MIKRVMYCLCAVLSVSVAQAQDIKVGVRAGLNSSSVWNAKDAVTGGILAPHAGLLVNAKIDRRQNVQAEVLYSGKGFTETKTYTVANQKQSQIYTINMNYIDVPVLYQYNLTKPDRTLYYQRVKQRGFFLTAGPQFSALLGASTKAKVASATTEGEVKMKEEKVNLTSYVRNFDVSLVAGIGYRFNENYGISTRYAASLLKTVDVNSPFLPATAHNGVLQASFTYYFPGTL